MTDVSLGAALLAGVVSFLSPCVLPLVPGYLAYVSGISVPAGREGKADMNAPDPAGTGVSGVALSNAAGFILGFSIVFVLLGASATAAGQFLRSQGRVFDWIAGAVIAVLGLHVMGVIRIPFLYRERRFRTSAPPETLAGSVRVGMAFGFGWAPCIGPILAAILGLAATQQTIGQGILLLSVYSAGLGVPLMLTAMAAETLARWIRRFRRGFRVAEVTSGLLLVGIGGLVFTANMTWLARQLIFLQPLVL